METLLAFSFGGAGGEDAPAKEFFRRVCRARLRHAGHGGRKLDRGGIPLRRHRGRRRAKSGKRDADQKARPKHVAILTAVLHAYGPALPDL